MDTDAGWRVVPLKKIGEHRKTLLAKGFQQAEDEGEGSSPLPWRLPFALLCGTAARRSCTNYAWPAWLNGTHARIAVQAWASCARSGSAWSGETHRGGRALHRLHISHPPVLCLNRCSVHAAAPPPPPSRTLSDHPTRSSLPCRSAGLKAPEVEIRWRGLSVKSTVAVTDKPVPGPLDKLVVSNISVLDRTAMPCHGMRTWQGCRRCSCGAWHVPAAEDTNRLRHPFRQPALAPSCFCPHSPLQAHLPFNKGKVLRKHTIIDSVNGVLKVRGTGLLMRRCAATGSCQRAA